MSRSLYRKKRSSMSYSDDEEYDERSDEYDDEEDYDCNGRSYGRTSQSRPQANTRDVQDYAQAYAPLDDDVLGDQSSDEGEEDFFLGEGMTSKKASRGGERDSESREVPYMFFDFRHGPNQWPEGVELIDHKRAAELLEKARKDAEAELKLQQEREALKDKVQDKDKNAAAASQKKKNMRQGGLPGDFMLDGFIPSSGAGGWGAGGIEAWLRPQQQEANAGSEEQVAKDTRAPEDATFETLNDGSTALLVTPGKRLKIQLSDLLEGGDASKEKREKEARRRKVSALQKRRSKLLGTWEGIGAFGASADGKNAKGFGGRDSPLGGVSGKDAAATHTWNSTWKEWVNEYTVTMDIKIQEPMPQGMALFQTALVHAGEHKGQTGSRGRLKQSDGEALLSPAGGVGVLGYFGDSKARVKADRWHRVAISVKCCADSKQKGEMLTYVDSVPGAVVKSEAISANGRFSIDPTALFIFSSSQPAMMARTIAVRTIRVEAKSSDEKDAKAGLARDRVLSMFNIQREREIDLQRKGLSLAPLFGGKPRPMWAAPALIATFGDPFIEGTMFEGSSCLAWSFEVVNLIFQRMISDQYSLFNAPAAIPTRMALGDVANIFAKSAPVFKDMARLLKTPNNSQRMSFLRKLHTHIAMLPEGESILLPAIIEGREILLLLERNSERYYTLVVINTDPLAGLAHHAVSPVVRHNRLMYRTCLVLSGIHKKNALDDVFWMGVYNLCLNDVEGNMDRFYHVLLPFITGKPLEVSLVEAELAANASKESGSLSCSSHSAAVANSSSRSPAFGPWRTPQRAQTQYVRCLYHAINFILTRRRGVSALRCKQVGLALRLQMVEMIKNDLDYLHPDANGHKVCLMAFRQLSYRAVKIADRLGAEVHETGPEISSKKVDSNCSICLENVAEDAGDSISLSCGHSFHRLCIDELVNAGSRNCPLCRNDLAGAGSVEEMIDKVRNLVESCQTELLHSIEDQHPLPAPLDLDARDSSWTGYALAYDVEYSEPNPGQVVALQKFVPINMLQIPARVNSRSEAVSSLRLCDKLCTLLDNQTHNVKNTKHLVLSLIENTFVHVIPIPKPRKDPRAEDAALSHIAARSEKRKITEEAKKREIAAKREELRKTKGVGKKNSKKSDNSTELNTAGIEDVEDQARRLLDKIDSSPGEAAVLSICSQPCIWDEEISYELQVELLLVLQRLMEHFSAAVLSLQASRPLDALRIILPGCMCAIGDAIIRRRAFDNPSVACAQLMGVDATGRQLGVHGFGIDAGVFATQTETIEVHSPELVIARAAILDYFDSPLQRKLEKIFQWEDQYYLAPGRNLIKYLRLIAREIAMPNSSPHMWLCDHIPESSKILKNFPELRCYRDICFMWKYFLNPDLKAFSNSSDAQELSRMHTVLCFHWSEEENGYRVENSIQRLFCRPNPNEIDPKTRRPFKQDELPKHRYPSTATPSFFAPPPLIKTEDDVIYRANLPSFDHAASKQRNEKGFEKWGQQVLVPSAHLVMAALGQRDSELLLSFLTVPYLRLPLVLNFFATDDRVHKLALPKLRDILDSVLFEPGRFLSLSNTGVEPVMVPTQHPELLASVYGALLNELFRSPESISRSVLSIMDSALSLDTGSVCDSKSSDFNASVEIILYVTRMAARVKSYLHFAVVHSLRKHESQHFTLRDKPPDSLSALEHALEQVGQCLRGPFADLLDDYLTRLDEETSATPEDEQLLNRNSRLASDLHAHKLLCFGNCGAGGIDPLDQQSATAIVSSFIYLTTRHTWNKSRREMGRLLVPEFELYQLFCLQRRRLVTYMDGPQAELDAVLEKALQTATSATGTSCELSNSTNMWGKLHGSRASGRFVLVGPRVASDTEKCTTAVKDPGLTVVVEDSGLQGVEMDLQVGQMTLRAKHLAALDTDVANMPQVREVFGESTMQASLLEQAEHRKRFKLIGFQHEIDYWHEGHSCCPAISDRWERDYDPAELHETEMWIPPLFEPIRKAFFSGPQPPALQFMMAKGPLPESAELVVLLGLHPSIGGAFKMVYIFRSYRCVQVYECVSHARQYWFVMHLSTDCRFSQRHLQHETRGLVQPFPAWWQRGGGEPYPMGVSGKLSANIDGDPQISYASCAIVRDVNHELNLSGSKETLVPKCLLLGLIPEALLDSHRFWQDQTTKPGSLNYRRLRGYPLESSADYMLLVDVFNDAADTIAVTGMPERTVRVERRNYDAAARNFKLLQRIETKIEQLCLACAPPKPAQQKRVAKKQTLRFAVDDLVETLASDLISGLQDSTWVPCKVLTDNNDGTYDVQHTNEWSWLGVVKRVPALNIQPRTQENDKGKGIWRFEGLSDSEDDAFRSDGSADDDAEKSAEKRETCNQSKPLSLSVQQFGQLDSVLEAAGWNAQDCEDALERIAAQLRRTNEGQFRTEDSFCDMTILAERVREECKNKRSTSPTASGEGDERATAQLGPASENRMLLVDLLFIPRRSRLFAMAQALCRIENLSHIVAWTKSMEVLTLPNRHVILDLVDLPRLKLSFAMRHDFEGKMRLFSLDHADLFVSNDFSEISDLVAGIPHSVLLRNAARGESQLLVPVLPPVRPEILTQPFTTEIVIDRNDEAWMAALSQRFFLYPIHVSSSFIVTKGLNSALYLLLLRLLHRDYQKAFLMADSIATDAKFSEEGAKIFNALSFANDDPHPDAHSVRLKVTLVTMGCGETMPWDLTAELASYIEKMSHVSATCRISFEEELQLLSSSEVVMDEQSPKFKADQYDPYLLILVKNRFHYLRARASLAVVSQGQICPGESGSGDGLKGDEVVAQCFVPPRTISDGWPWYQDNTVFGEEYNQAIEIRTEGEWLAFLQDMSLPKHGPAHLRQELAPPGGWLTVVFIHTLWSAQCIKLMPRYAELVPMHPYVTFLTLKGDLRGLDAVAKELKVEQFPTLLVMRGAKELEGTRITGLDRLLERLMRVIGDLANESDRAAHVHLLVRMREEAGIESDEEVTEDEQEQLLWCFDVECCGPSMRVCEQGLCAEHCEEEEQVDEPPIWEYRNDDNDDDGDDGRMGWGEWLQMPQDLSPELEKHYRRGVFYSRTALYLNDGMRFAKGVDLDWNIRKLKLNNNMLTGIQGHWDDSSYLRFQMRRRGARVSVKGEEKVITPEQKRLDHQMRAIQEQRKAVAKFRRQEQYGKNAQAIRGTGAFHPNSGIHSWTLRWEHEPELTGSGDAVGLASSQSEAGGPAEPPLIGGAYDDGSSLALYASGTLIHAGAVIGTAARKSPRVLFDGGIFGDKFVESKMHKKRQKISAQDEDEQKKSADYEAFENGSGDIDSTVDSEHAEENKNISRVDGSSECESEKDIECEGENDSGSDSDGGKSGSKSEAGETGNPEDHKTCAQNAGDIEVASSIDVAQNTAASVLGNVPVAPLWGKGSLVTCIFDTAGGGTLSFEVDGERLDVQVTQVFSLLGAEEVYPCIAMFPLMPTDIPQDPGLQSEEEEESEGEERQDYDEDDEEEDGDEEEGEEHDSQEESEEESSQDRAGKARASKGQKELEELAKATKLDISVIAAMPRGKREELRKSVKAALDASRRARVTIISPVPAITSEQEPKVAAEREQPNADESKEQEKADDKTEEEDEGDEEDEEGEEVQKLKLAADESTQPLDKIRWMWEQSSGQWEVYSVEISREIELARRANALEHTIRLGDITVLCKVSGGPCEMVQERGDETQRLRRHVMKDGIFGELEMMSVIHKPPISIYGEACLQTLQKVWSSQETLSGHACGLGFIFIYSLLQGQTRCKVLSSGFSDWWLQDTSFGMTGYGGGGGGSTNDSHRLGLLLTQLLVDAKTKSVFASVLNVMGRNKQLSVRFPEFKDTRKNRSSTIFNGWITDQEPKSAILDLFNKLIPLMQGMKKSKHGSFVFPPKSLTQEMPAPPSTFKVLRSAALAEVSCLSADLSDLDCKERLIRPIGENDIRHLAAAIKHTNFHGNSIGIVARHSDRLPLHIDDEIHLEDVIRTHKDTLFVLIFHATWCGACRSLHPLLRKLALRTPSARFLRIDIESLHRLSTRLQIKTLPTIKIVRPLGITPVTSAHVLGTIDTVDESFVSKLLQSIAAASTPEEVMRMNESSETVTEQQVAELNVLSSSVSVGAADLAILSSRPLESLVPYICYHSAKVPTKTPTLDVGRHAAAQSAVAQSMLKRMKDDVASHLANETPTPKLRCLSDQALRIVFAGPDDSAERRGTAQQCIAQVEELLQKLQLMRNQDTAAILGISSISHSIINYIDLSCGGFEGRLNRSKFVLRRAAGQAAEVWPEFLFASILSSEGEQDIQKFNPYLPRAHVDAVMQLVMLQMLRANRVGHLSRCIGAVVVLLKLLRDALEVTPSTVSFPKFVQAADDVASIIAAGRHFISSDSDGVTVRLDPRFLIFEFTWNILLRKKQVDIVNDFVEQVKSGNSKVKQMIMGAGKTTVVAPLLALILADGKSLLLSVVPKALLEMSRTQMRETFANIITKRISTFKFERSTIPQEGMRLNLENSARNRGIVVATPTSIKSVMLVYIETLRNLQESWSQHATGPTRSINRERVDQLSKQATELQGILSLFKQGVMLLDEVDLILHPLKSELNFPLGEKVDLDCSDAGERWSLPIHILDAIFYCDTKRASVFEARGFALDVLNNISAKVSEGFGCRALQRLPHITLLNLDWYHDHLKPVLADWVHLWLQKQHLHGVSRREAISYIVEGAVARSESTAKVTILESAIAKTEIALGLRPPISPNAFASTHSTKMTQGQHLELETENEQVREQATQAVKLLEMKGAQLLAMELEELKSCARATREQRDVTQLLYHLDSEVEEQARVSARQLSQLQQQIVLLSKQIQEIETPRDDSFDNATIVWCSTVFKTANAGQTPVAGDDALVLSACAKLEEAGFTCRRCGTQEEAAELSCHLRRSCALRCIIAGGNSAQGCRDGCTRNHASDGPCLVCGDSYGSHSGHTCMSSGRTGSWMTKSSSGDQSNIDYFRFLTGLIQDSAPEAEQLPPSRMLLFAGNTGTNLKEEQRLEMWKMGIVVVEDKSKLLEWVEALGSWSTESVGTTESVPDPTSPVTLNRNDSGVRTLRTLRSRLHDLEMTKEGMVQEEDAKVEELRRKLVHQHSQLELSIQQTISTLSNIASAVSQRVEMDSQEQLDSFVVGPSNGRDASLACAWLKLHVLDHGAPHVSDQIKHGEYLAKVQQALRAVSAEIKWLSQAALAAKVMAHVTSPTQKKLLNLCYDWLRTFLPHILAKVNRVSFGLLSSTDCAAALEADAMVPQSRLKLAVPFVGKDVPSRSSEFAHPDVILGLTILGYRYSGMRFEDFADLIDSMSADFSQEIGPSRDRPSSQRHEQWVLAAGGRIRGIKTVKTKGLTNVSGVEVVQLKFLQKSNLEQMQKLYDLWSKEPLAIHYYLSKFVFPAHMRSQKIKISASGQALGGDMLVGRRLGFSGTPSDLLPKELGKCDYETGDDGKMLKTVLDQEIVSYELLPNDWSVQTVLARIATAESPRYHALIDTGALITGYSNLEVAAFILKKGLSWCDGVVFLDENDEKQVLVRATGRAVPADQCGVPLDRRFAFYDQIHTTGMDIKHVVNATAVITLGKDMTFRDYVQGAYRMREIGSGQKIQVYIIPEVADLIAREIKAASDSHTLATSALFKTIAHWSSGEGKMDPCTVDGTGENGENVQEKMLEALVAWLVINSMRTEQTQWSMLCVQNVSNIYRKNAFSCILDGGQAFCNGNTIKKSEAPLPERDIPPPHTDNAVGDSLTLPALPELPSLKVFDETIDFSLEAGVPDPIPFGDKLQAMLTSHVEFIITEEQRKTGHQVLTEVLSFTTSEFNNGVESCNLDTQQEREMEQEQEKEVKARRDQQIEVEKFVEREYSRHQERPSPWSIAWLGCKPGHSPDGEKSKEGEGTHPFFGLRDFHLLYQMPLDFPPALHLSRNYFNPAWSGLRRLKNVVCLLEWCPNTSPVSLRLLTDVEHAQEISINETDQDVIRKVHTLLKSEDGLLSQDGLADAIVSATNAPADPALVETLWRDFGCEGKGLTAEGLQQMLVSGRLYPAHCGRYWVAVSLAEAETLRRVLHLRQGRPLLGASVPSAPSAGAEGGGCELALHLSQAGAFGVPGSTMLDASSGWRATGSGASHHEMAVALGVYRYFDGDMHYTRSTLAKLIRALHKTSMHERDQFFSSTTAVRRRLERKWQETPLATLFSIANEWVNLKQNAQAAFVRLALNRRELTPWEAFVAFDADNNSRLSPSELYGALRWLQVPELTAEDVVDFFELADANRDGMIDYSEFMSLFDEDGKPHNRQCGKDSLLGEDAYTEEEEEDGEGGQKARIRANRSKEPLLKVEPFGADELRAIMVQRRRREIERQRKELARRAAQQADMDIKLFREELQASARRKGGSNPRIYLSPDDDKLLGLYGSTGADGAEGAESWNTWNTRWNRGTRTWGIPGMPEVMRRLVVFSFESNSPPLRTAISGKSKYVPVLIDDVRKNLPHMKCKNGHFCTGTDRGRRWGHCALCHRYVEAKKWCKICQHSICARCHMAFEDEQVKERSDPSGKHTFIQCELASDITLHIPPTTVDLACTHPPAPNEHQHRSSSVCEASSSSEMPGVGIALSADFSVTIELKLKSLPANGQLAALLRFSTPDCSQARRRHIASLYLDARGNVFSSCDARGNAMHNLQCGAEAAKKAAAAAATQLAEDKQILRERLHALVQVAQGPLAGNTTSILLEGLNNSELAALIDELAALIHDQTALKGKIEEAVEMGKIKSSLEIVELGVAHVNNEEEVAVLEAHKQAQQAQAEKAEDKKSSCLREGRWVVLSVAVQVAAGRLTIYLDGHLLSVEENLDPHNISLGPRVIVLGGGKAAQSRGGCVRRVLVHDTCLSAQQARLTYYACAHDHPAIGGKLTRIQAAWRARRARKRNAEVLEHLAKVKQQRTSKKK